MPNRSLFIANVPFQQEKQLLENSKSSTSLLLKQFGMLSLDAKWSLQLLMPQNQMSGTTFSGSIAKKLSISTLTWKTQSSWTKLRAGLENMTWATHSQEMSLVTGIRWLYKLLADLVRNSTLVIKWAASLDKMPLKLQKVIYLLSFSLAWRSKTESRLIMIELSKQSLTWSRSCILVSSQWSRP